MERGIGGLASGLTGLVVVAISIFWMYTNPYTPEGHEGYVFEQPRVWGNGGFQGTVRGPGNYGFAIWRNRAINVDFRPHTINEDFKILAADDLNVAFRFQGVFKVNEGTIQDVVEKYGGRIWYKRFVKEPFRSFVRDSVQAYDSREIKTKREVIANQVQSKLMEHLKETPFVLVKLVVGNIDYPKAVAQAVEKKLAAEQELEKKTIEKKIAMKNAEIRIEEAKGIAQAQKIINATLTKNYLQHEAINAQLKMADSPNHTTVYIPSGTNGIPMVYDSRK
jgi:regulator of protease activity HflC (stomatin/prohibitin superfamily)